MKNLLITGGLGYIGSSLIRQLDFSKYNKIIIVDLNLFETEKSILKSITDENMKKKIVIKNINFMNYKSLENIFLSYNIQVVIHLGGLVGDPACAFNIELTDKINTISTNKIVDFSIKYGVSKFIFASSCSVYGINENVCIETTKPKPISEYAISKLNGEKKLYSVKDKIDEIIIYRFSTLYGVSNRVRFDLVANLFYAKARWENSITLFGGWHCRRARRRPPGRTPARAAGSPASTGRRATRPCPPRRGRAPPAPSPRHSQAPRRRRRGPH